MNTVSARLLVRAAAAVSKGKPTTLTYRNSVTPSFVSFSKSYVVNPWSVKHRFMSTSPADYFCVHVFVKTKPGTEEAFKEASLKNARNSAKEPGVARFDVLQDTEDPCSFVLVEVYKDKDKAPVAHKETAHYLEWRESVADMMAEPRQAKKFVNHFPKTVAGWDYPSEAQLE